MLPPVQLYTQKFSHGVVVVLVVVLEVVELVVVELVVLDDELLELVVVEAGVPSQATVATYPLYGPSCPGAGPHVQPLSHVLNPPGYLASAPASQIYVHWPTHPGINHLQSR